MNVALITGASSGLGCEYLKEVCERYPSLEIWLIARRADRLNALCSAYPDRKIKAVPLDLDGDAGLCELSALLEKEKPEVRLLINNAGVGKLGNFGECDLAHQLEMINLNCRALTAVTHLSLKYMREGSVILNVCSIAAFAPTPRMTVYSSTKAFVLSFSRSLREELMPKRIRVCAVCPGPMKTEFLDVADITGRSETFRKLPYCEPADIAARSLTAAERGRAVLTCRAFYKFYRFLAKILPHSLVMKFSKT